MLSIKIADVVPLSNMELLVFFENGEVKKFDVKNLLDDYPEFQELKNEELFNSVKVEPGGYGISWNAALDCSEGELYQNGRPIELTLQDFISFVHSNLISTKDAASILQCSKQNIDDLVKRNKLHPIKLDGRYNIFLKAEVEKRTW